MAKRTRKIKAKRPRVLDENLLDSAVAEGLISGGLLDAALRARMVFDLGGSGARECVAKLALREQFHLEPEELQKSFQTLTPQQCYFVALLAKIGLAVAAPKK